MASGVGDGEAGDDEVIGMALIYLGFYLLMPLDVSLILMAGLLAAIQRDVMPRLMADYRGLTYTLEGEQQQQQRQRHRAGAEPTPHGASHSLWHPRDRWVSPNAKQPNTSAVR